LINGGYFSFGHLSISWYACFLPAASESFFAGVFFAQLIIEVFQILSVQLPEIFFIQSKCSDKVWIISEIYVKME